MAKITPFLGNISGKIAGNVFSSGKGGAYIRQFVKPTNANSASQIRARIAFSAGSRAWGALSTINKSAWNSFAFDSFSPKFPKPGVTYSGASAYASLLNQALSAEQARTEDATIGLTPDDEPLTLGHFSTLATPPDGKFTGMIQNSAGDKSAPLSLKTINISANAGGESSFIVSLDGSGVDPTDFGIPVFKDPITNENIGFVVYGSRRIPTGTNKPAQIQKFIFASIPPFSLTAPAVFEEGPDWFFTFKTSSLINGSKYLLSVNDLVDIDLYAVSSNGSSVLLGSQQIVLS